jgi:hypothetical protein
VRTHARRRMLVHRLLPGVALAAASLVAACGGAVAAPAAPTAAPAAIATAAGATSWAAWIDHQGFGGAAGPDEVRRTARYIEEHGGDESLFYLDKDIQLVAGMVAWLDAHPATPCWADYHARVRASLMTVHDAWVAARPEVEAGHHVPADAIATAVRAANAAKDVPEPSAGP